MECTAKDEWLKFFLDAKIPRNAAEEYTLTFVENRIQFDMLLDLDKDYLNGMGITVMGDIIAILRHAKICHVQNAKKNILFKPNSISSVSNKSSKPTSNNYRSVSLKSSISSASSSVNANPKTSTISTDKVVLSKKLNEQRNIKEERSVRIKVKNEKNVDTKLTSNVKTKPSLVRTPVVTKRPSDTLKNGSTESESSSDNDKSIDDITRKMAKKSIFDRLGNASKSGSPPGDSSERAVTSSTSSNVIVSPKFENVQDQKKKSSKILDLTDDNPISVNVKPSTMSPKPGTLSYRMFSRCQSTSTTEDEEVEDTTIELVKESKVAAPPPITHVEYTVALPPSFINTTGSSTGKSSGSVFDRLGDKNKNLASSSNPGKSILKLSSQSIRISKTPSTMLQTSRRDPKSVSSLNGKLSLIRSQMDTEGVLGKPDNLLRDKIPAKSRIGSFNTPNNVKNITTSSESKKSVSVRSRLTLSDKAASTKLDILAKRTLDRTPAHVKARLESEHPKFVTTANGGAGIKARLGFKKPITREKIVISHDDFSILSKQPDIIEREILSNDEEHAEITLDGKKKVRFHCVEKKIIPPRTIRTKRISSSMPYNRNRTAVW